MKRILTVQDLSCLGKCSITVALPVISAMGVEAAVLPTAVLSTHTAFPSPVVRELGDLLTPFSEHWANIGAGFDGICTGYLSSPEQARQVMAVLETLRSPETFVVTDPVMGDGGKLYSRITPDFLAQMRLLCAGADLILPNLTEACFLTDTPYREDCSEEFLRELLRKLTDTGCAVAAITGISLRENTTGVAGYEKATGEYFSYSHEKLPQSYHGTGDIFCAVTAGAMARGMSWQEALKLAADFTCQCIRLTSLEGGDRRYGVCFEKALPMLVNELNK